MGQADPIVCPAGYIPYHGNARPWRCVWFTTKGMAERGGGAGRHAVIDTADAGGVDEACIRSRLRARLYLPRLTEVPTYNVHTSTRASSIYVPLRPCGFLAWVHTLLTAPFPRVTTIAMYGPVATTCLAVLPALERVGTGWDRARTHPISIVARWMISGICNTFHKPSA